MIEKLVEAVSEVFTSLNIKNLGERILENPKKF